MLTVTTTIPDSHIPDLAQEVAARPTRHVSGVEFQERLARLVAEHGCQITAGQPVLILTSTNDRARATAYAIRNACYDLNSGNVWVSADELTASVGQQANIIVCNRGALITIHDCASAGGERDILPEEVQNLLNSAEQLNTISYCTVMLHGPEAIHSSKCDNSANTFLDQVEKPCRILQKQHPDQTLIVRLELPELLVWGIDGKGDTVNHFRVRLFS